MRLTTPDGETIVLDAETAEFLMSNAGKAMLERKAASKTDIGNPVTEPDDVS